MSRKEIMSARRARDLQNALGWPNTSTFRSYVNNNDIVMDITVDDIDRATFLWGEALETDRGKMSRPSPHSHEIMSQKPLPKMYDKRVDLYADVMQIRKRLYLVCKSGRINFTSVYPVNNKSVPEVLEKIKLEIRKYSDRELKVVGVHMDNAFNTETFKQSLDGAIFVPYATNKHVAIAEREIRTIKERVRSTLAGLPYKKITDMMLDRLVVGLTKLKNRLPTHAGLTKTISPATIVEGKGKLNFTKKWVRFGAYCEVWVKTKNNMEARTICWYARYANFCNSTCHI